MESYMIVYCIGFLLLIFGISVAIFDPEKHMRVVGRILTCVAMSLIVVNGVEYKNTNEIDSDSVETEYQITYHPAEIIGYDATESTFQDFTVENTLFQTVDDEIVYTVYGYYDYDAYLLGIAEDKVVIVYKVCEGALG